MLWICECAVRVWISVVVVIYTGEERCLLVSCTLRASYAHQLGFFPVQWSTLVFSQMQIPIPHHWHWWPVSVSVGIKTGSHKFAEKACIKYSWCSCTHKTIHCVWTMWSCSECLAVYTMCDAGFAVNASAQFSSLLTDLQTLICPPSSNPILLPSWMMVCLSFTFLMLLLLPG